jgi:hypothetical protein
MPGLAELSSNYSTALRRSVVTDHYRPNNSRLIKPLLHRSRLRCHFKALLYRSSTSVPSRGMLHGHHD